MEKKAGISEYVSDHPPIQGVIKSRYSDFMVNEINLKDEVVKLTSTEYTTDNKEEKCISWEESGLTENQLESLKGLKQLESMDILVEELDKGRRTLIHQYIKGNHPHLISSTLKNSSDLNVIRVMPGKEKRRGRGMGNKDHCQFVLFKENKSTMEAIEYLCRMLKVKTSTFSFAGTKDKRAITSQLVTAFRVEPKRLSHLNKALRNVSLGNFTITQTPLKLGDLKGNSFRIILRKLKATKEEVDRALTQVARNGFINYFGTQRFGTTEVCNSAIGKCIVKSDWMGAIEGIMKPRAEENAKLAACRQAWSEHKDPHVALEALAGFNCVEQKLLQGLCRFHANNYVAALSLIPRNMRLMYLHAYQSLLWNLIASRRIRTHGLKVLVGDLYQKEGQEVDVVTEEMMKGMRVKVVEEVADGVSIGMEDKMMDGVKDAIDDGMKESVGDVTRNGTVSIEDVVLPLVGHDVKVPRNEVGGWIVEMLQQECLQMHSFKHNVRDYSLSGGYRRLLVRPRGFSWQMLRYTEDSQDLLSSDLHLLRASHLTSEAPVDSSTSEPLPSTLPPSQPPPSSSPSRQPPSPSPSQPPSSPSKPPSKPPPSPSKPPSPSRLAPHEDVKQALKLEFTLPASTYATMLLREVTRQDTSSAHQSTLN